MKYGTLSLLTNTVIGGNCCVDYSRFEMRQQRLQEQAMELDTGTLKTTQKRSIFVR